MHMASLKNKSEVPYEGKWDIPIKVFNMRNLPLASANIGDFIVQY